MTSVLSRRPRPSVSPSAARSIAPALFLLFGAVLPGGASAQAAGPPEGVHNPFPYRVATFSPRSGPPGTVVAVHWEYLPALTPVRLGLGAERMGFQALKEVLTDARGQVNDTIVIPYWADLERPHILTVHDFYFHVLAISSEFTVTSADGVFRREGRIAERTPRCGVLEGDGGQTYYLAGEIGSLRVDERATVEGRLTDAALCGAQHAVTMQVTRIVRRSGEE